jgi:hypothetical protein
MVVACNKGFSFACNIATGRELLLNLDATRRQNVRLRVVNGLFLLMHHYPLMHPGRCSTILVCALSDM